MDNELKRIWELLISSDKEAQILGQELFLTSEFYSQYKDRSLIILSNHIQILDVPISEIFDYKDEIVRLFIFSGLCIAMNVQPSKCYRFNFTIGQDPSWECFIL